MDGTRVASGLLLALLLLLPPAVAFAQAGGAPEAAHRELRQKRNSLLGVIDAISRQRAKLERLQAELESDRGRGRQQEITAEIQETSVRLAELERNFSEVASGVDPHSFDTDREEQVDFTQELRDLLGPLIHELRRMTSRPREIDRLRSEMSDAGEDLVLLDRAVSQVSKLRDELQDPVVLDALSGEEATWTTRRQAARTRLAVARQKLEQRENERTSVAETVRNVFELFFKSRGRNLLLALGATILFLVLLRQLHKQLHRRGPLAVGSPSFRARLFNLLYAVFTGVGGLLVFLIVLYVFGDWVLLILMIMLIMGFVWASKQALPAFWSQVTLLLNMGVVREGERVTYLGLPFEVASLGFYTQLVNPSLEGGAIRLPINDLTELRSRPFGDAEPWFPTDQGDWVRLGNGTLGRVVQQTLEFVRFVHKGGAVQTFPTEEFPSQQPVVLSDGFRVAVTFGVDYQHVLVATQEVADRLQRFVADALSASRHAERCRRVVVEFASAGASSLDLAVLCDFSGESAPDHDEVVRLVNRLAVDACNAYGWVIPFQQVTLHMAQPTPPEDSPS